jgi:hypothetical protein
MLKINKQEMIQIEMLFLGGIGWEKHRIISLFFFL